MQLTPIPSKSPSNRTLVSHTELFIITWSGNGDPRTHRGLYRGLGIRLHVREGTP